MHEESDQETQEWKGVWRIIDRVVAEVLRNGGGEGKDVVGAADNVCSVCSEVAVRVGGVADDWYEEVVSGVIVVVCVIHQRPSCSTRGVVGGGVPDDLVMVASTAAGLQRSFWEYSRRWRFHFNFGQDRQL